MNSLEHIARRTVLQTITAAVAVLATCNATSALAEVCDDRNAAIQALEHRYGGRLGVASFGTASANLRHRADEAFPLCSTSKFLSSAYILARVDRGEENLARKILYSPNRLVPHSPVTTRYAGEKGMTIAALCYAAMAESDNTAANLMLDSFGGPLALTRYLRTLGDENTRLDRYEPDLNDATPGDRRDTTTPAAMLAIMQKTLMGPALSVGSRARLAAWMIACQTGGKRLRATFPPQCRAGDKTGSGAHNTTNDIAILWPNNRPPILIAAYYTGADATDEKRDAVLADVGRIAIT
jgi:beta-lactamase class A